VTLEQENERMAEISQEIGLDRALARLGVDINDPGDSEKISDHGDSMIKIGEKDMTESVEHKMV
jgi:hypothetical protein